MSRYLLLAEVRFVIRNPSVPGRVTVITPTYRRPKGLREAIESVRAQSYQDWEQIIVSDGPDPEVGRLVAEYNDPRIQVHHTHRTAVWGAHQRNYALKFATGEFVLYLDDDNVIFPNCLDTMVKGFVSPEIGFVVCPVKYGTDRIMAPTESFGFAQIDLLNYMVRRTLVQRVWGQSRHHAADFVLIDRVRRLSRGRFLTDIIGHHR